MKITYPNPIRLIKDIEIGECFNISADPTIYMRIDNPDSFALNLATGKLVYFNDEAKGVLVQCELIVK